MRMVKKMVSAATITVFLFCCYFISSSGSQDDCVYAATGSNFTVSLKFKLKESESLRWFKDTSVVFHRRQKQVITGKNDDVDSTGSLKLTQLTKDKSGRYRPEVISAEGINVGDLPSMRLCVLDSVKKPTVTMTCIGTQKHVSFICNAGQGETIEWLMNDERLAEKGKMVTRVAEDVANTHFSCSVSNIVSSEISQPVQQNCYKLAFPDVCDSDVCIPVRTGAGILLLVILTVIVCCTHKKAKVIKDKDELPLKQQHHHQKQLVGSFPEPDFCADCGLEGDNGI